MTSFTAARRHSSITEGPACSLQTSCDRVEAYVEAFEERQLQGRWHADLDRANLSVVKWHLLRGQKALLQAVQNTGRRAAQLLAAAWPRWRVAKAAVRPKLTDCLLELLPRLCALPTGDAGSLACHLSVCDVVCEMFSSQLAEGLYKTWPRNINCPDKPGYL